MNRRMGRQVELDLEEFGDLQDLLVEYQHDDVSCPLARIYRKLRAAA